MMRRQHTAWTDQFSDYLSGDLSDGERAGVEEHVAECGACREVLAELGAVQALAGEAQRLEPPRDLWPGVAVSIGGQASVAAREPVGGVIALPTAGPGNHGWPLGPSRVRLGAAAVLLIAISATTSWWVTSGAAAGPTFPAPQVARPAAVAPASGPQPAADLADQLRVLELFLASARESLDPSTVLVLERNLNAIEAAIIDSRDALTLDPGNAFLIEHLERMYERKLFYLQDARRVAEWSG